MRTITTTITAEDLAADTPHAVTHVAPVEEYVRGSSERPQMRDPDTGMLMWEVGILRRMERYGRPDTEIIKVRVGAPEQPPAEGMVTFDGLELTSKVTGTGRVGEGREVIIALAEKTYWRAEAVHPVGGGRRSGGRQTEGGEAA